MVGIGELLWDVLPEGKRLGGAPANFAFHAAQLGARAVVVSRVGDDTLGQRIRQIWRRAGINTEYLQIDPEHPTGTVNVELRAGIPRYDIRGDVAWDYIEWTRGLEALARQADVVSFGALGQRCARSRATIQRFVRSCRPQALRIFDPTLRPGFFDADIIEVSLRRCSILKANEAELRTIARLLGIASAETRFSREHAAHELLKRYRLRACVITRGEKGSETYTSTQTIRTPAPKVTVADTVGAGDAFTAGLVMTYVRTDDWEQASETANKIAAYVASRPGGTPKLPKRLRRLG